MQLDRYEIKSDDKLNEKKIPVVRVDKSLNKYSDIVLFPEKVEKAKQAFDKLGLPDLKKSVVFNKITEADINSTGFHK